MHPQRLGSAQPSHADQRDPRVSAASNIIGTGYDLEKGAPGQLSLGRSTLPPGIIPATRRELVDIADPQQLARFGLNVSTNWDENTLCEKWEGLAVIPLNDPAAPNDFLLLIGNDNDFKSPGRYSQRRNRRHE